MSVFDFPSHKPSLAFKHYMPQNFLLALSSMVQQCYTAAKDFFDQFDEPERDGLPVYRRTLIEDGLVHLAERFKKQGLSISAGKNLRNNSHRILVCGPIVLTQSKIESRRSLPRQADFRETYAKDPQLSLFQEMEDDLSTANKELSIYSMLVHRPSLDDRHPEFIDVIFPNRTYTAIVDRIELLQTASVERQVAVAAEVKPVSLRISKQQA